MSKQLIDLDLLKIYDTQIKEYIDNARLGQGINSFELTSAEALGDYSIALGEDSKAISDNSVALGKNSMSGCKGYYVKAIDFTNNKIYLSNTQVVPPVSITGDDSQYRISNFETPAYTIGNEIALLMEKYFRYFCGTIKSVSGNVVELNEALPFNTITTLAGNSPTNYAFFVPNQPEIGAVDISMGGVALGTNCKASGEDAVAEGNGTMAAGKRSHTEGYLTKTGLQAHAEGQETEALGYCTHTEGYKTLATGTQAHAEGYETQAHGSFSHTEGRFNIAKGAESHAEGGSTQANATRSHTEGNSTIAASANQHVQGKFNIADSKNKYAHIVGNGEKEDEYDANGKLIKQNRSNAHTLDWNGNAWFAGNVTIGKNNDKLLTESEVETKVANLVDSAPETLNTLNELAQALGDDPNFATTVATQLGNKVDKVDGKGLSTNDFDNYYKVCVEEHGLMIGVLSSLNTSEQSNLVGAINEIYDELHQPYITEIPTTLEANKQYNFGEVTTLNLAFPTFAYDSEVIYLTFKSGATPTALAIDTTNTCDIEVIPESNTGYEIFGKYNGEIWIVNYSEYTVSEV